MSSIKSWVWRIVVALAVAVGLVASGAPATAAPAPVRADNTTTVILKEQANKPADRPKAAATWCAGIVKALAPAPVKCVTSITYNIPAPVNGVGGMLYEVGVTIQHPSKLPTQATLDKVTKVLSPTVPFSVAREVKPTVGVKLPPRVFV